MHVRKSQNNNCKKIHSTPYATPPPPPPILFEQNLYTATHPSLTVTINEALQSDTPRLPAPGPLDWGKECKERHCYEGHVLCVDANKNIQRSRTPNCSVSLMRSEIMLCHAPREFPLQVHFGPFLPLECMAWALLRAVWCPKKCPSGCNKDRVGVERGV